MSVRAVFKGAWQDRHKLGNQKQPQDLAAFLPAVLEIQETPPNPLVRWLASGLLTLVLIVLTWACFGHVNIVASAEGKIIPSSRVKQIQPLEKGVVKAILVNEGGYVTQGQALIELDSTLTVADKNRLQSELHTKKMTLAVSQALLSKIEAYSVHSKTDNHQVLRRDELTLNLSVTTNLQESQLYQHLLWQQWQEYSSQHRSLQSSFRKAQAEQAASKEVVSKLEQTLPIVTGRASTLRGLHQKDFVSEIDYLQAEQNRIQVKQDLAAEKQRNEQYKAAQAEVYAQIDNHVAQTSGTLLLQISDQSRQISALEEELIKARDLNDKQVLYAPVSGRVQELAINTVGGVVTEAQQLMLIIPDEEQLEVEVFLENKDVGFVRNAMPAEIKVHTFPFTKHGVIDAEVSNISNDAIIDEQRGLIYSMQLRMAKNTINVNGEVVRLIPGMSVTAEIITGDRRLIEFFLAPLLRARSESVRER